MADGPTAWQLVGAGGGIASIGTGIWGAVKWLFGRADRKEAALDAKEAQLVAKLEARIQALEDRDEKREDDFQGLRTELTATRTELHDTRAALIIVAQEVAMTNPTSPALALARTLLRERFPLDPHTPSDMADTLRKI